jgi:integrase
MPLTDTAIRNAKPGDKPKKLFDGGGLYLEVAPNGGKWWRLKYRFEGKEKRLSLGVYPTVSLKAARQRRDEARQRLSNGIDPSVHRKAAKASRLEAAVNSLETIAREWYVKHSPNWAKNHAARVKSRLEKDVFPWMGKKPIAEMAAPEILAVLRRIESRGALETAHRALGICGQVFRYAIATGRAERDPTQDLKGALPPTRSQHFAAMTEPQHVADLLRTLDGYQGTFVVQSALRLAPLVFVRPGELRQAEWADIDLETAEWRYTVSKTKAKHIVPLSQQAVHILEDIYPLTGEGRYVFPSARSPKGDRTTWKVNG